MNRYHFISMITMKYFLLCVSFFAQCNYLQADRTMGPVGNMTVNSIFNCQDKLDSDDITVIAELKSIDDQGSKALFATLTNKIPLDNSIGYDLIVRKWENGGWKNIYSNKGKICRDLVSYLPKVWNSFRMAAKPQILVPCPIKPGTYILDKFQLSPKDVTLPSIFYGRFLVQAHVLNKDKVLSCLQGEGVSRAPV